MSGAKGKLIHSQDSPYARRVRIVLAELHLPYESDLRPSVYAMTELGDLNPNLKLPVWTDGAGTVFESNLIARLFDPCVRSKSVRTFPYRQPTRFS